MTKFTFYVLIIILILYILSPLDLHPFVFDDLIASGFLYYLWQRFKYQKRKRNYYTENQSRSEVKSEPDGQMSLEEAHGLLNVSPDASWEEVQKAYKERMARSHPDKVAHLSEELQEKARELAVKINKAFNIIKRCKGR